MVTGASIADLALVDARHGVTEQSRWHAVLMLLLKVPHIAPWSTRWTSSTTT